MGLRAGKEGDRVYEWGTGSLNAWEAALHRARLKQESESRRIMSLVVESMTIGIETPLATTPENGH